MARLATQKLSPRSCSRISPQINSWIERISASGRRTNVPTREGAPTSVQNVSEQTIPTIVPARQLSAHARTAVTRVIWAPSMKLLTTTESKFGVTTA